MPGYPLAFAVFPFAIWAAFRFGQRGTATAILIAAGLAMLGAMGGAAGETMTVDIANFAFAPAELRISAGTDVQPHRTAERAELDTVLQEIDQHRRQHFLIGVDGQPEGAQHLLAELVDRRDGRGRRVRQYTGRARPGSSCRSARCRLPAARCSASWAGCSLPASRRRRSSAMMPRTGSTTSFSSLQAISKLAKATDAKKLILFISF